MIRKYWKYLKYIVIPVILTLICFIIYIFLDFFSMGVLADWFDKMFIYETSHHTDDGIVIVRNINWGSLKTFIAESVLVLLIFGSWAAIVISDIRKSRIRRGHSHQIAEYLHRFLIANEPMPLELPQEDTEIFAKISEIKLEMNRKETMLHDETNRKNDMITYLAHDLKTPLTSVIGYLSVLKDEPDLPARQRAKYTEVAVKKAERLKELTNELFEICRFNLSHIELQIEKVNLSRMLEQMIYEFEPLLKEKSLVIRGDISPDIHYHCDIDKTERIMDNLIRNAVNYSYPNSEIKISLNMDSSNINIVFENQGKTIPQDKLNRIFEQFYRVDSSRSSTSGGSGLGLAIAKQLIEAHGGTISAKSENETIYFSVILPYKKIV